MSARCFGRWSPAVVGLLCAGTVAPWAQAAPLAPAAGDRVARHAAFVSSEVQEAIAEGRSDAAEALRDVIDANDSFRVYHRDHQVLVAITTRRNLFVGDKRAGERQAANLVRDVLQTKFSHLLETEAGFTGLDAAAVRVVFIEPDAFEDCPGRRSTRVNGTMHSAPVPFGGAGMWSNGWATPAPCTSCK